MAKIFVIDSTWDGATALAHLKSLTSFRKPIRVSSVAEMVEKVLKEIGDDNLEALWIDGHGAPGFQSVGCGTGADNDAKKSLSVDASKKPLRLKGDGTLLARLAPKCTKTTVISLLGCQVAANASNIPLGRELLKVVATTLGGQPVVQASEDMTHDYFWPFADNTLIRCNRVTCWKVPSILPSN